MFTGGTEADSALLPKGLTRCRSLPYENELAASKYRHGV